MGQNKEEPQVVGLGLGKDRQQSFPCHYTGIPAFCQTDIDESYAYRLSDGWLLEVGIDEDLYLWLESYANHTGVSIGELLHKFIVEGLEKHHERLEPS